MSKIVTLAPIFKDNMIVQRERNIPVWGSAPSGATIEVTIRSIELSNILNKQSCIAADHKWRVDMPAIQVGGPYEMLVNYELTTNVGMDNIECNGKNNETKNETKNVTKNVTTNVTTNVTISETNNVTNNETKNVTISETKNVTNNVTNVETDIETIIIKNILCGDVWIAGGQSNMEYALVNSRHGYEEKKSANYPEIRVYTVPRITHENIPEDPEQDRRSVMMENASIWVAASQKTVGSFYAVAYSFAKELHKSLEIPIGIIECAWGGTSASCWLSKETLISHDELSIYWDEYEAQIKDIEWDEYERKNKAYDKEMKVANDQIKDIPVTYDNMDAYFESIAFASFPWPPVLGPKSPLRPCGLYHTMLRKITPFAVKGVIFYQGESDTHRPASYYKLFHAMMSDWRRDLESAHLPFLMVQLAAFGSENPNGLEYALLREQQTKLGSENNCGTVVAMDCGHPTNIHPLDKRTIGMRLAALAKGKIYDFGEPYCGPEFEDMTIYDHKATIQFKHTYDGLRAKGPVKGFSLAGDNHVFIPAKANLEENQVIIWAEEVPDPIAVRYGFTNYMEVNLENSAGFPAVPFRTDAWK